MSTKDRDKCSLSSILPLACRDGADAFARNLHSRLRSLGSENGSVPANESSWLGAHESSIAVSHQPRHSAEPGIYFNNFNFGLLESPGSPEEEITESELQTLINSKDNLVSYCDKCTCSKYPIVTSNNKLSDCNSISNNHESDSSDGPYYDTESDTHEKWANGSPEYDRLTPASLQNGCDSSQEHSEAAVSDKTAEYTSLESQGLETTQNDSDDDSLSTLSIDKEEEEEPPGLSIDKEEEEPLARSIKIEIKCESFDRSFHNNDDDDREEPTPRVRRCSSLKTGKTPPGTPGQKKIVRFADVFGLDLADVRTFLDEIPKIPSSAYNDLFDVDISSSAPDGCVTDLQLNSSTRKPDRILLILFQQPGGLPNFLDLVRERCVCLENAIVNDSVDLSIKGTVRVRNLDFHKSVHIRYTLDLWQTYADLQAVYVENSCDGFSDTFSFLMYAHTLNVGQRLEFAVRFQCKGCQYWDNNNGINYGLQCLPTTNTDCFSNGNGYEDNWGGGFY